MINRLLVAVLGMALLSGCTSLDRLKKQQIDHASFQGALAQNYKEFSQREADQYDWTDSGYFARKALKVLKGEDVMPEAVEYWDIKKSEINNLKWAYKRVMNVRTAEVMAKYPKQLADVQYLYDCWIEEQEEGWQSDDINRCRMDFLLSVTELEKKLMPVIPKVKVEDVQAVPNKDPEIPPLAINENKTVYFGLGVSKLDKANKRTINDIISEIKAMKSFSINISGHTDRSGDAGFNEKLSEKRAESVSDEFVAGGVDKSKITTKAFGESAPAKPTADGVVEPLNRRVEINITGSK